MMEFLNNSVPLDLLPKIEHTELKKISPDYLKVLRIELMISSAVVFLIAAVLIFFIAVLQKPIWITVIAISWLLLSLLQYFLQQKAFSACAYAIRDKDILYQSGWLIRILRTCPFNRIQHSSVNSGPLERKFNLSTLILYTAGTDASDVRIPGLQESEAIALKEWINKKVVDEEQQG